MKFSGGTVLTALFTLSFNSPAAEPFLKPVGDLRFGLYGLYRDDRNGAYDTTEEVRARIRLGLEARFADWLSGRLRFAGRYSSDQSHNDGFTLDNHAPETDGLRLGESTFDQAYLEFRPNQDWRIRLGRLQTQFELVGVARKTLDRNDSPNTDISWTDGAHLSYHLGAGWQAHFILQHNASDGPTNVLRSPLDFDDSSARFTYFAALENTRPWGPIVQRGLDLTYIADGLRVDGPASGRRDDYIGLVGRTAAQWPLGSRGTALLLGLELGYAPNTPRETTTRTGSNGYAGGFAGQASINFLDIFPGHSLGLLAAVAEPGWLISPDFRSNNTLLEARYRWQVFKNQKLEFRIRLREDLEIQTASPERREDTDFYLRYTIGF